MDKAEKADAKREAHEDVCTERWRELRDDIKEFKQDQHAKHEDNKSALRRIMWTMISALGLLALELLMKLIDLISAVSRGIHP